MVSFKHPRLGPERRRLLALAVMALAVELVYVFVISAGHFTHWPNLTSYVNDLAEGFRHGHLHLATEPPPALLAAPNPFDAANVNYWLWDASLHGGHYYLYWGPVPALLLLGVKVVARIKADVGDQYVLFAFYSLFLIAGAVLIARMTTRLFPELPRAFVLIATVGFAYTSPTTYMFATPGIYEAAIGAGQACLLLGLVVAFEAVWNATELEPRPGRLLAAGACWGAAVGCRISAVLPAAALVALTALFSSTASWRRWRGLSVRAVWLGAPVAAVLAGLSVYNKLRFDSWFEVGVKYQLNTFPFLVSRKYVPLNVFSYLLRPLGLSCRFPFLSALYDIGLRGFPRGTKFPPSYSTHEPAAGLWVTSPWTWLVVVAAAFAVWGVVRWRRAGRPEILPDSRARAQVWCVGSFVALSVLMPMVFLPAFISTIRYVADFSAGFALLSTWGAAMALARLPPGWPRWTVLGVLLILALVTTAIGLLLGFQGYDDMFRNHNPALYESLRRKLAFCS